MPTVSVDKELFFAALGEPNLSIEKFEDICFDYGIELDDITTEKDMVIKQRAMDSSASTSQQSQNGTTGSAQHGQKSNNNNKDQLNNLSERVILKIDVSANRYDLLCFEGLVRALRVFMGKDKPPQFHTDAPQLSMRVITDNTAQVRPHVVCAVLRDVEFTQASYDSFIDFQEKLHSGICRRRSKVAIGTHDLDKVKGPFVYDARPPQQIKFKPLNHPVADQELNAEELFAYYELNDKRLAKFIPIIRDSPVYPVVLDSNNVVMSLPPIINGDHSKITLDTKNIFIECTATDLTKAKTVLNLMVTAFSQYCKQAGHIEQVRVEYDGGSNIVKEEISYYPDLSQRSMSASIDYINSCIGATETLSGDRIIQLLSKMGLSAVVDSDGKQVTVQIPPYRSDILHPCDIMEDVAVAYGINNLPKHLPATNTIGAVNPLNKLTDLIRNECAFCGWTEVLTLTLCSREENFGFLRLKDDENSQNTVVSLLNPATAEYQVVRTSLLPGLLKSLNANKSVQLPVKIYECADVVLQDSSNDRGARNVRKLCVLFCGKTSGFEFVHGQLDRLMHMLEVPYVSLKNAEKSFGYSIRESSVETYFPGRQAEVLLNGKVIGNLGILHPQVLKNFDIHQPASALEIEIGHFI
ncbi:hypothetical protein MP228_005459 [Amoeboaphelidium protococcarum]|nr:hypothetical protein MP228_005459 [Amoeboaphelidium protococcarum]